MGGAREKLHEEVVAEHAAWAARPHCAAQREWALMVKGFYGESFQFFLSTATPARKQASDFIASQGLALAAYEPMGDERGKSVLFGGFTLAERSG